MVYLKKNSTRSLKICYCEKACTLRKLFMPLNLFFRPITMDKKSSYKLPFTRIPFGSQQNVCEQPRGGFIHGKALTIIVFQTRCPIRTSLNCNIIPRKEKSTQAVQCVETTSLLTCKQGVTRQMNTVFRHCIQIQIVLVCPLIVPIRCIAQTAMLIVEQSSIALRTYLL